MRDEAIALWHRLVERQSQEIAELQAEHERQKGIFGPFMQHACNIDVASFVDDLVRRNHDSFEQLRESLMALDRPSQQDYATGTGVDFDPNAKPFMQ